MRTQKLSSINGSVIAVTSTATKLTSLIDTAAGSATSYLPGLNACNLVVEDGNVRIMLDGNTPTSSKGLLLVQGGVYQLRNIDLQKVMLIRTGSTDVAVGVEVGFANPDEPTVMSGSAARVLGTNGGSTAAANDLTLPAANFHTITGNTTINGIATAGWTVGSEVTLLFTGTPTIKHNTAPSAGFAKLFLSGSVDRVAAANGILKLVYDGTQWQETSRKVA